MYKSELFSLIRSGITQLCSVRLKNVFRFCYDFLLENDQIFVIFRPKMTKFNLLERTVILLPKKKRFVWSNFGYPCRFLKF